MECPFFKGLCDVVVTPDQAPLVLIGNVRRHRGVTTDVPLWPSPAAKLRGSTRRRTSTGSGSDQYWGAVVDVPDKGRKRSPPGGGSRPKAKQRVNVGKQATAPLSAAKTTPVQDEADTLPLSAVSSTLLGQEQRKDESLSSIGRRWAKK